MVMLYMVQGYIFISVYNFVRFKQNDLEHIFFKSVVTSYILKVLFDGLFVKTVTVNEIDIQAMRFFNVDYESIGYCVSLFLFAALIGVILSLSAQSKCFNDFLIKIGIKRTTNQNIWDDVIKPDCWLMVYLNSRDLVYLGQFKYGEEFANKPIIVLEHYKVMDLDGNIKADYTTNQAELAIIDTKDIERVEVTYP